MKQINFLFGIHSHQPVGNFDGVFRDAFRRCYAPLLERLRRHPAIRCAMHHSGPLIEWIEANEPGYFDTFGELVERGQIEVMSGGFYEPILTVIPADDALGQIRMMNEWVEARFGYKPRGLWCPERIWEPQLASLLSAAGIQYTLIDESHFSYSGLTAAQMFGYYITEDNGAVVRVFPIDKTLRYTIPFKMPEVTIEYLKGIADETGTKAATLGDDGEKFGVWPGTHKWVYEDGYLDNLFKALEANADWIKMPTFGEYVDAAPPAGRVYLPTASYEEMMEWALPVESQHGYERFIARLKGEGAYDENKPYVRGGFWRNFMAKYSESNLMNKKMLRVSAKVRAAGTNSDATNGEAVRELYRSQCNCAYWHGLFGGLYLNYLRHAVYERMIAAENLAEADAIASKKLFTLELADYDADGVAEVLVENPVINAYVSPHYGGSILELDYRPKNFNLTNVLTRRKEAYHAKIVEGLKPEKEGAAQPKSAHDLVKVKESGLHERLIYDWHDRRLFLDHFLGPDATLEAFAKARYTEAGDFVGQPYTREKAEKGKDAITVELSRAAGVKVGVEWVPVRVEKAYRFGRGGSFSLTYTITNLGDRTVELWFGTEANVCLLAGYANDRRYVVPGKKLADAPPGGGERPASQGELDEVGEVRLEDDWSGVRIAFALEPAAGFWRFPLETVSQSEDGFERNYQASSLLFHWRLSLAPSASERVVIRTTASHAGP
jgi:hypothetical protein